MRRFHIFLFDERHITPWRQSFFASDLDAAVEIARAEISIMLEYLKHDGLDYETCGFFVCEGAGRAGCRLTLPEGARHAVMLPMRSGVLAPKKVGPTLVRRVVSKFQRT
jgi:hypothetical protein